MDLAQAVKASSALLDAFRSKMTFAKVSEAEAKRMVAAVRAAAPVVDWCKVTAAIVSAKFADQDEAALLDVVGNRITETVSPAMGHGDKHSRTLTQNYEHWMLYVPSHVWEAVREGSMEPLFYHLCHLGLRSPSETTSQTLALAILHQTEGFERATKLPGESRLNFMKTVKHAFKMIAKKLPEPPCYVPCLPPSTADFQIQFPALYAAAFSGGSEAVASPISEVEMHSLRATTRMRNVRVPAAAVPVLDLYRTPALQNISPDMLAFGQGLMRQVQHLTSELSLMRDGGTQLNLGLPALHNRSSKLALTLPTPPSLPHPAPIRDAVPQKAEETDTASNRARTLEESTAEIVAALKGAKKKEHAAPTKPTKKLPKASPTKVVAAKPPARKRPAAASPTLGLLLGCVKCRGCHTGCSQCQSPSYTGKRYKR